ncbi:MAG: beta-ketoacyl-ACP synthase II [Deltaproteobacteria bacterium]|nr:beta-ketoacyl-ACP synthase II [Deltaproteobacteria bacterium]
MKKRVVITGIGAVSPLGNDAESLWEGIVAGRSGIDTIKRFDPSELPVTFAGEVTDFDAVRYLKNAKDLKKLDRFLQFALGAGKMAVADSGLEITDANADDIAVYVGSGVGGLDSIIEGTHTLDARGARKLSVFTIPKMLINLASGHLSLELGTRGPNFSHVSACATGNHSIGEALRCIQYGDAKVAIAGGAEAAVLPLGIAGFARMRALSTRNDEPQRASRPFDAERSGFVMGEGAGVLVIEELEHARARGARIYGELAGYGATSDAHHMTAPDPEGRGAMRCMQRAMNDAGWAPDSVQYINAHGTSTQFNDSIETLAIKKAFGDAAKDLAVSSTKSMTGHLLGGAGGLEAVICTLALTRGVLPPTINLENPDPACDLDYVPNVARETRVRRILTNGFGFGGTNATLAIGQFEDDA